MHSQHRLAHQSLAHASDQRHLPECRSCIQAGKPCPIGQLRKGFKPLSRCQFSPSIHRQLLFSSRLRTWELQSSCHKNHSFGYSGDTSEKILPVHGWKAFKIAPWLWSNRLTTSSDTCITTCDSQGANCSTTLQPE